MEAKKDARADRKTSSEQGPVRDESDWDPWFHNSRTRYELPVDVIHSRTFIEVYNALVRFHAFCKNHQEYYKDREMHEAVSVRAHMSWAMPLLHLIDINERPDGMGLASFRAAESAYFMLKSVMNEMDIEPFPEDKRRFGSINFPVEIRDEDDQKLLESSSVGLTQERVDQQLNFILREFDKLRSTEKYRYLSDHYGTLDELIFKEGRTTAPQDLNDKERFLAAAEAKEVGAMFERARGTMSRRAAAKEAGMDHKNLGKIENGETDPSLKTMRKIAEGIGYDVEVRLVPKGKC